VGIWKSRKNELFQFAAAGSLSALIESVESYANGLYWSNYPFRFVSDDMLAAGDLAGLRFLIMPSCYYLTEAEAEALDRWLRAGGTLLCEAHLGGYNATTGRHSRRVPGCGLAEAWGVREADSTSSYHLRLGEAEAFEGVLSDDVRKALCEAAQGGGRFFPISLRDGGLLWGANRYVILEGEGTTVEGTFDGVHACVVSKPVGKGKLIYCGTNLGEGAVREAGPLQRFLCGQLAAAGLTPTLKAQADLPGTVHLDALGGPEGLRFVVAISRADRAQGLALAAEGEWRGVFGGQEWQGPGEMRVEAGMAEVFVKG
jgi:hypothetical protein